MASSNPNAGIFPAANPANLLPFGQRGFVVDTTPNKPKLADRAIPVRYLRAPTPDQYLVLLGNGKSTRLVRPAEFILTTPTALRPPLKNPRHLPSHPPPLRRRPVCETSSPPSPT